MLVKADTVRLVDVSDVIVEDVETVVVDNVVVAVLTLRVELTVVAVRVRVKVEFVMVVEEALPSPPQTTLQSFPHQGSASPTSLHSTTHSLLQAVEVVVEVRVMLLLVSEVAERVMLVLVVEIVVLLIEVVCVKDVEVKVIPQATPQTSPQSLASYSSTQTG